MNRNQEVIDDKESSNCAGGEAVTLFGIVGCENHRVMFPCCSSKAASKIPSGCIVKDMAYYGLGSSPFRLRLRSVKRRSSSCELLMISKSVVESGNKRGTKVPKYHVKRRWLTQERALESTTSTFRSHRQVASSTLALGSTSFPIELLSTN
jgi:hypothetical protein